MDRLITNHDISHKDVLLRLDLDVPIKDGLVADNTRLLASLPTLEYCLEHARKTLIIGHLGRPTGNQPQFSLKPAIEELKRLIGQDISLVGSLSEAGEWRTGTTPLGFLENLRFFKEEKENDPTFARSLANFAHVFVHDAFAVSHHPSASGIEVPKLLPSFIGLQFEAEVKALRPITESPKSPIIAIIGGHKTDKIEIVDNLLTQVDLVLVGGSIVASVTPNPKVIPATLTSEGLDIDQASIDLFKSYIASASTLIWNGPVGKYEDNSHGFHGTSQLAEAISTANAYKVAGGGDTLAVINQLNLNDKFNHLSTGGGAMLYYIAKHTLPALEAINNSPKIA